MGFEGYLEDLGVCDILQILSLSKKTGTLLLSRRKLKGAISFADGQVIRASSDEFTEGLGQLLVKAGVVTTEQVDQALNDQKGLSLHRPLGQILVEHHNIPVAVVEQVVERQIEKIVYSFFSWKEGSFQFRVEELESFGSALVNPLDFMLERGLSTQWLAIKGKKLQSHGKSDVDDGAIERELAAIEQRKQQQGIDLLRGMLAELEHPEFCGGIVLLILRYASEIMERAIVFDIRRQQLVGVGQFGLKAQGASADDLVRKMRFDLEKGSLFAQVIEKQRTVFGELGRTEAEQQLRQIIGSDTRDVFLSPLINDGVVVALLFGDTLRDNRSQRSFEAFEVFLSQAGLALEQALSGKATV